ncbi:MAG TPA: hypothetical protein VI389_12335, partial [Geobacteraceae bacterium]
DFLFDHTSSSVRILSTVWALFIYVSGISLLCKVVADLRRRRRDAGYRSAPWLKCFVLLFSALVINYLFITVSTLGHHINIMMPRLMYMNILAAIILIYVAVEESFRPAFANVGRYLRTPRTHVS